LVETLLDIDIRSPYSTMDKYGLEYGMVLLGLNGKDGIQMLILIVKFFSLIPLLPNLGLLY